jgi:LysR family glycine cleavage system transcriptional activator
MRRLPPFAALRSFESAARQLSFSRAAEELCVTPSAVSHQVRLLEEWVGVPLFERAARKVSLTQRGRELYASAGKSLDDLSIAFRVAVHRRTRNSKSRLRVCSEDGFSELWLAGRLNAFLEANPEASIELHWGKSAEDYKKCRADIVFHYGRVDRLPYESISQWRYQEFAVCSPRLPTRSRPLARVEDLRRHRLLHERGTEPWMQWLGWAGLKDISWADQGTILPSAFSCHGAAVAGHGVAQSDELVGGDLLLSGRLIKPLGESRESDHTMTLLCRRDALEDSAAAAFVGWVRPAIDAHWTETRSLRRQSPFRARRTLGP